MISGLCSVSSQISEFWTLGSIFAQVEMRMNEECFSFRERKKGKTIEFDPESSMNEVRKSYVSMSKGWVIDSCLWANVEKREEILDEKSGEERDVDESECNVVGPLRPACLYRPSSWWECVLPLFFPPLLYIYINVCIFFLCRSRPNGNIFSPPSSRDPSCCSRPTLDLLLCVYPKLDSFVGLHKPAV